MPININQSKIFMEPITMTLEVAKEAFEAARKIKQVYDTTKQVESVAVSEGTDQIVATKDLASSAGSKAIETSKAQDISSNSNKVEYEPTERLTFVDELPASYERISTNEQLPITFVDEIPNETDAYIPNLSEDYNTQLNIDVSHNQVEFSMQDGVLTKDSADITEGSSLSSEEKAEIKAQTGWSDKIVNSIRSKEEAQIYMNAGLVEGEIDGKPALLQPNIEGDACNEKKWPDWSNKDLASEGYPPRDASGKPYELHHIGQNPNSPLAELTYDQHHSDGNFKILHTFDESSIDRTTFNKERRNYWKERSNSL